MTAAFSSAEPSDLATLLREVEAWVEDESLYVIRFLLDDRIYFLEAGVPEWDTADALGRESSLPIQAP